MKLNFLQLPSEERKLYIEEAAGRRGISPRLAGSVTLLYLLPL